MENGKTEELNWLLQEGSEQLTRSFVSFENLPVWQDARRLVVAIYELTKAAPCAKDRPLTDQIRRAALSVMNNIAEGYERGSEVELSRFLYIAKGSCGEVRSILYAIEDLKLSTPEILRERQILCLSISRQLGGFIRHLEDRRTKTARTHG